MGISRPAHPDHVDPVVPLLNLPPHVWHQGAGVGRGAPT